MAGGAGVLNADFGAVFLLAGVAERNQWCFPNHQFYPIQKSVAGLHFEGELQADGFHTGEFADHEMDAGDRRTSLALPPILQGENQGFGHVGFVHGGGR